MPHRLPSPVASHPDGRNRKATGASVTCLTSPVPLARQIAPARERRPIARVLRAARPLAERTTHRRREAGHVIDELLEVDALEPDQACVARDGEVGGRRCGCYT